MVSGRSLTDGEATVLLTLTLILPHHQDAFLLLTPVLPTRPQLRGK